MGISTLILTVAISIGSTNGATNLASTKYPQIEYNNDDSVYFIDGFEYGNRTIDWDELINIVEDIDLDNIPIEVKNKVYSILNIESSQKNSSNNGNYYDFYFPVIDYIYDADKMRYEYDYGQNSVLIDDYEYFQNLRKFGYNSTAAKDSDGTVHFLDNYLLGDTTNPSLMIGVCGYVAVQMVLGYYNNYFNDGIIPGSNVKYSTSHQPLIYTDFKPDFSPGSDHEFLRRLYNYGPSNSNFMKNPRLFQFPWMIKDIIDYWIGFINGSGFYEVPYTIEQRFYNEITDASIAALVIVMALLGPIKGFIIWLANHLTINQQQRNSVNSEIKDLLDQGIPVILTVFDQNFSYNHNPLNFEELLSHVMVAYGYTDDGRYIVNTGWGADSRTSHNKETYEIDTYLLNDHSHRIVTIDENYAFAYTAMKMATSDKIGGRKHIYSYRPSSHDHYCSCGHKHGNRIVSSILPNEYGFRAEYNWTPEFKNVTASSGDIIRTRRLRTGYIENEYLTLSAKRNNAGRAYLEYLCPFYVSKVDWEMALWSDNESLLRNSSIRLESFTNGEWIVERTFVYSELSKNKDFLYNYSHTFNYGTTDFRFIVDTNPVQNENNRGRLVIGNIDILDFS